jgi:hypothetical protein
MPKGAGSARQRHEGEHQPDHADGGAHPERDVHAVDERRARRGQQVGRADPVCRGRTGGDPAPGGAGHRVRQAAGVEVGATSGRTLQKPPCPVPWSAPATVPHGPGTVAGAYGPCGPDNRWPVDYRPASSGFGSARSARMGPDGRDCGGSPFGT